MTKPFPSDLEIAQAATLEPITEIAAENGISADRLEPYGKYVAKVLLDETTNAETARKRGSKYIVVTAVTPTPLGEGKTATSVSLAQGFAQTGRKAMLTLRQPAMGPTFGIKGGAAGGGYSQIVPMEKLNLHLTGDFHAVTAADLKADGALAVILADAINPNLLQTLEHTPALIHAGPFGNIATGNSSIVADYVGLEYSDYVITEAGFGADMGAERLFNVKCRISGLKPDAAVLVVTVRALKSHSGLYKIVPGKPLPDGMLQESPSDVEAGAANLKKHIEIVRNFGVQPVVAINAFPTDFDSEHEAIRRIAEEAGARVAIHRGVAEGGKGTVYLANVVAEACDDVSELKFTYDLEDSLETKLEKVATKVYGADGISIAPAAAKQLKRFADLGYGNLPVVIAKTHLSISSDASLKGAPTGWTLPVREVRLAAGAGYVYAICGTMRTMPGLSKSPAAERIGFDENGTMVGLS